MGNKRAIIDVKSMKKAVGTLANLFTVALGRGLTTAEEAFSDDAFNWMTNTTDLLSALQAVHKKRGWKGTGWKNRLACTKRLIFKQVRETTRLRKFGDPDSMKSIFVLFNEWGNSRVRRQVSTNKATQPYARLARLRNPTQRLRRPQERYHF